MALVVEEIRGSTCLTGQMAQKRMPLLNKYSTSTLGTKILSFLKTDYDWATTRLPCDYGFLGWVWKLIADF